MSSVDARSIERLAGLMASVGKSLHFDEVGIVDAVSSELAGAMGYCVVNNGDPDHAKVKQKSSACQAEPVGYEGMRSEKKGGARFDFTQGSMYI